MLKYETGFSVHKFDGKSRRSGKGLYFEELHYLIPTGINPCGYTHTSEIIVELEKLISGETSEYEWGGGERTWFISERNITLATDNFAKYGNIELPTVEILELMKVRKQLMEDWSRDDVSSLVKHSFEKVKDNRLKYIDNEKDFLFKVCDDETGLIVLMVLLEDDFNITSEAFCSQLKFDDRFFPLQKYL